MQVTKGFVGSANGSAARGAGVDVSTREFAVEGMGPQGLQEVAGGGSGEESNVVGAQDQSAQPHGGSCRRWTPVRRGKVRGE